MSARNRELLALIPVALLVTAGFTAVFVVRSDEIGDLSLIYGGYFLAICVAAHLFLRVRAAVRRPVPVPALRRSGRVGLVVIYRIDETSPSSRPRCSCSAWRCSPHDPAPARLPRARALPLPDRDRRDRAPARRRACPASAPGQRRLPRDRPRPALVPARRAREDLHRHLPRQLPGREARAAARSRAQADRRADDPAAEALRPAARRLGRGDGDAGLHPRPRQLADVLRRLPGAALRRHAALLLRAHRAWCCSRSGPTFCRRAPPATSRTGSTSGVDPFADSDCAGAARGRSSSRSSPRPRAACSARASAQSLLKLPGPFCARAASSRSRTAARSCPSRTPTSSSR